VRRIAQDNHGFLWLGAEDGLRRYDGYGFMRVPDSQNPRRVGLIIAQSLLRDRSGRVWFGADDSLGLYDPATGSFKQYRSPDEACGTVAIAHDISEDQDGLMWLATDDGLTALDPVTSKTTCYRPRYDPSIGEKRVIATLPSRDGTLWITSSAGLYTLDRRSGKVTRHIRLETRSGRQFRCTGFPAKPFQDSTGMIWVGLRSGGDLARIDPASGELAYQGAPVPLCARAVHLCLTADAKYLLNAHNLPRASITTTSSTRSSRPQPTGTSERFSSPGSATR
jgi:ligand-binding sensor domain-containing protein